MRLTGCRLGIMVLAVTAAGARPGAAQAPVSSQHAGALAPDDSIGRTVYREALAAGGRRILVSIERRTLWYLNGDDTLLAADVAVGMGKDFTFHGKAYHFSTPKGRRTVQGKSPDPDWIVPEWHYYERAARMDLEVVRLMRDVNLVLSDGSYITVRGDQVGRVNQFGNFWPFTPGNEIIFDGKIIVPPRDTRQRRVPDALGPFKLDMGNGYLIHGTHLYNEDSIGQAVSHGCVRMRNQDLERLYRMVAVGTPVFIF